MRLISLSFVIVVATATGRVDAGELFGATAGDSGGELYVLDPATGGVVRDVGPLNDVAGRNYRVTGLSFHPGTGVLYGSTVDSPTVDPATTSRLVIIDPQTAQVAVVAPFRIGATNPPATMLDLEFSRHGTLYGVPSVGSPTIVSIDIPTGRADGGGTGSPNAEGGGFAVNTEWEPTYIFPVYWSPFPDVLHWSFVQPFGTRPGVYSGEITDVPRPVGGNYGALDFNGQVLYGLNVGPGSSPVTHLVTFQWSPFGVTDVGRSVDGLEAIAFRPDVLIPEPSVLAASVVGFSVLLAALRRNLREPSKL
jgi:hypothetical protein